MIIEALLVASALFAADASDANAITRDLLPRPQQFELREGVFVFDAAQLPTDEPGPAVRRFAPDAPPQLRIQVGAQTRDAIGRIGEHLRETLGELSMPTDVHILPALSSADCWLEIAPSPAFAAFPSVTLPPGSSSHAYQLAIAAHGIRIDSPTEIGVFYGLQTLAQIVRRTHLRGEPALPCLLIQDWPALLFRGYSEDYGRNQLPTIEDHKRTIRFMARHKMNAYAWFIEPDHFVYAFNPTIGQGRDRFTFDEIRELVTYAERYYIDIVPTVELLGHMEEILSHPQYKPLAEVEGGSDLCAACDDSFELVRKIVSEVAPAFTSGFFHCGLDESFVIGQGRSAEAVKEKGLERVLADYYKRLNELLKTHNKLMVMYADIVLKYPAIIEMMDKDIVMMFWDYIPRERYEGFDTLAKAGFVLTSLSGLWDWNNVYPVYSMAKRNMDTMASQSLELDALGHFVSSWGDPWRGAAGMNLSELNSYGVAYTAAVSWKPEPIALNDFSPAFALQFYGCADASVATALTRLAECQGDRAFYVRQHFQAEPAVMAAEFAKADENELGFWTQLKDASIAARSSLEAAKPSSNADYLQSVILSARMLEFTADLVMACRSVGEASKAGNLDRQPAAAIFDELADRQQALWTDYHTAYLATNRPLNLAEIQKVWDWMHEQLTTTAVQLREGTFKPAKAK